MKRLLIIFSMLTLSLNCFAQTGRLSISQVNNGSVIDVSIYLKRTGTTSWNLGFASLVFNYNNTDMLVPVELAESIWDNNTNAQYDDQSIALYNGTACASVEIGLSSTSSGTSVPTDSVIAGKIRFNILNPQHYHNITWNTLYSAVLDNAGNDITSGITFLNPPNAVLPVELSSFYYNVSDNNVFLYWTTLKETNNKGFTIERKISIDNAWSELGFVEGLLNSNHPINYLYQDRNVNPGIYNYRLKQTDVNGNFTYFSLNGEVKISNPMEFHVYQNYPNPFNPSTAIKYKIPADAQVKITLYDVTGKEIKTLFYGFNSAGYHELQVSGADLLSGIYFYKIETGGNSVVKSMAVVK
ncbi:MAG: hypothetical protein HGGPFJEG_02958 [Ignavibacteria bacterium]|nr:hypothetical protein [Ignavibacteria bacterium]